MTRGLNLSCPLAWAGDESGPIRGSMLPASHSCGSFHVSPALGLSQSGIMTSRPSLHMLPPNLWASEIAKRLGRVAGEVIASVFIESFRRRASLA